MFCIYTITFVPLLIGIQEYIMLTLKDLFGAGGQDQVAQSKAILLEDSCHMYSQYFTTSFLSASGVWEKVFKSSG